MEVACSLEDVARVLADSGYNFNDDSCFDNAVDLPAALSVLDSPDSFPESPCSDEDIARVLDIARMPSPSLLDNCTTRGVNNFPVHQHHTYHHHHLPSPTDGQDPFRVTIQKTRDPCITNAFLQNTLLSNDHPDREPTSLNIFSIDLNSSPHNDNTPNFSSLIRTKDIDTFNNYFNSSSALSPVSETDVLFPGPIESLPSIKDPIPTPINHINTHISPQTKTSGWLSHPTNATSIAPVPSPDISTSTSETPEVNTTQTKRKRRRKGSNVTPKPKRRKQQDSAQTIPKPKPAPKQKTNKIRKETASTSNQKRITHKSVENNAVGVETDKHKSTNFNSGARKTKKSKNNSATPETLPEHKAMPDIVEGVASGKETNQESATSSEIGSTNGVVEETKGLRRSSRSAKNAENYNLRLSSLVKRVETERKQQEPKQPKGKVKPPPLSKYRRRTANARERDRMKEINDAFDVLKGALPDMEPDDGKSKITKFTILKLALNYIASLQEILETDDQNPNSSNESNEPVTQLQSSSEACSSSKDALSSSQIESSLNPQSIVTDIPMTEYDTHVHKEGNCGEMGSAVCDK